MTYILEYIYDDAGYEKNDYLDGTDDINKVLEDARKHLLRGDMVIIHIEKEE